MPTCKHCNVVFPDSGLPKGWVANHSRWCWQNPKRSEYSAALELARSAKKKFRNQYHSGATMSEETKRKLSAAGIGRKHSAATKRLLRQKALSSAHRRLKKGVVEYRGIKFDSSWEVELAIRLDALGLAWTRPDPIPWVDDDGISHHYFPDFFLPNFNVYLDPKNPQAFKAQEKKIACLIAQYSNLVFLKSLDECRTYCPVKSAPTDRS